MQSTNMFCLPYATARPSGLVREGHPAVREGGLDLLHRLELCEDWKPYVVRRCPDLSDCQRPG